MPFTECLIQRKLELLLNCFYAFTSKEICSHLFSIHAIGHTVKIHHVKTKNHPFTNKKSKQCKLHIKYDSNWSNIWYNSWIKPQGNLVTEKTASISNEVHYQSSFQASRKLKPSAHNKETLLLIHLLRQGLDFFI